MRNGRDNSLQRAVRAGQDQAFVSARGRVRVEAIVLGSDDTGGLIGRAAYRRAAREASCVFAWRRSSTPPTGGVRSRIGRGLAREGVRATRIADAVTVERRVGIGRTAKLRYPVVRLRHIRPAEPNQAETRDQGPWSPMPSQTPDQAVLGSTLAWCCSASGVGTM